MPASSITANDQYCEVDLRQTRGSAALFDIAGTFSGRLNFEGAVVDAPTNSDYRPLNALELPDGDDAGLYSEAVGTFFVPASGFTFVRVRSSAWVSGTAEVNVRAGAESEMELKGSGPATETSLNSALVELEAINAKLGALGAQLKADSASVVLATDQAGSVLGDGATPISPTSYLLQTAAAAYATDTAGGGLTPVTSSLLSAAFDNSFRALNVRSSITAIGTAALTLGQKDSDHSIPVVFPSDQAISIGADLNVEKIGGEYVSSGDGSIDGKMPSMLHDADGYKITRGQKTMANSLPVVFASDQVLSLAVGGVDVTKLGGVNVPAANFGVTPGDAALPTLSMLHAFDAAGATVNQIVGQPASTPFSAGSGRLLVSSNLEAIKGLGVDYATGTQNGKLPVALFTSAGDQFSFTSGTAGKIPVGLFDSTGAPIPLGQTTMNQSIPVTFASDQTLTIEGIDDLNVHGSDGGNVESLFGVTALDSAALRSLRITSASQLYNPEAGTGSFQTMQGRAFDSEFTAGDLALNTRSAIFAGDGGKIGSLYVPDNTMIGLQTMAAMQLQPDTTDTLLIARAAQGTTAYDGGKFRLLASSNVEALGGVAITLDNLGENGITWTGRKALTVHSVMYGLYNNTSLLLPVNIDVMGSFDTAYGGMYTNTTLTGIGSTAIDASAGNYGLGTQRVVLATNQPTVPTSVASLPLPAGAATEATLAALNAKFSALGQGLMAASAPVVIASNQSAIPASQSGAWNVTDISGTVSLPTGAATEATLSVLAGKGFATQTTLALIKAKTDNLDALLSTLATDAKFGTLGQKNMAGSAPVVLASDQASIPVAATLQTGANVIGALSANQTVDLNKAAGVAITSKLADGTSFANTVSGPVVGSVVYGWDLANGTRSQPISTQQVSNGINASNWGLVTVTNIASIAGVSPSLNIGATGAGTLRTDSNISLNGVAAATGSGVLGTGTQRVVLATDDSLKNAQAAAVGSTIGVTGLWKAVTGDQGYSNATLNIPTMNTAGHPRIDIARVGNQALDLGNGATGAGTMRFTLASDGQGRTNLAVGNVALVAVQPTTNASGTAHLPVSLSAVFDDASPTSITENNFGALRMSANRNLYGTIRDAAGNERGMNVNASNQAQVLAGNWPTLVDTNDGAASASTPRVTLASQADITISASSAKTVTFTQSDVTNYQARGIKVFMDVTNMGTANLTLEIDEKDPVSGTYYSMLTGATEAANTSKVYKIFPGATAAANAVANDCLPRTWRVKVVQGGVGNATYSLGATYLY